MLLALDIGNTSIAVGLFREDRLVKNWKLKSESGKTCDEYLIALNSLFKLSGFAFQQVDAIIFSSVVPPLTSVFQKLCRDMFEIRPLIVGPGLKTGMPILYENPAEVGADRVVSGIAAFEKYGGPVIVADFGTATTFDAVSEKGEYLGGAIAPGIQISAEALYLRTARLPRIEIKKPEKAVGKTTVSSMQSGLYFGYIGLVSSIISSIKEEIGKQAKVVATGGSAPLFFKTISVIDSFEPNLVLDGLKIIYSRNRGGEG